MFVAMHGCVASCVARDAPRGRSLVCRSFSLWTEAGKSATVVVVVVVVVVVDPSVDVATVVVVVVVVDGFALYIAAFVQLSLLPR